MFKNFVGSEEGDFMDFNPSAAVLDELLEVKKKLFFPLQYHQQKRCSKILLVRSNLVKKRGKIYVLRQQTNYDLTISIIN